MISYQNNIAPTPGYYQRAVLFWGTSCVGVWVRLSLKIVRLTSSENWVVQIPGSCMSLLPRTADFRACVFISTAKKIVNIPQSIEQNAQYKPNYLT